MHVVSTQRPATSFERLISASEEARAAACAAIEVSRAMVSRIQDTLGCSLQRRLNSQAHRLFARLDGFVGQSPVAAVIRTDGSVAAEQRLLAQASVVVAMGETFGDGRLPASLGVHPVASTLTLVRACDQIRMLEFARPDLQGEAAEPYAELPVDCPRPGTDRH